MFLKIAGIALLVIALILIGLIVYGTLTVYKPKAIQSLETEGKGSTQRSETVLPNELSFMIWNVGYCGLGKQMDFFYDGGKTVFGQKAWTENNLKQNANFIAKQQNVDFVLLQEVDRNSRRSYKLNQYQKFKEALSQHTSTFATNYKVQFLPFPPNKPLGKILSGLASYTKYQPLESERYQFPGGNETFKKRFRRRVC